MKNGASRVFAEVISKALTPPPVEKIKYPNHPPGFKPLDDDEYWDEVKIVTVPRWKESEFSGDEWRVSAHLQLLRKGHVVYERGFSDIGAAASFLPSVLLDARLSDGFKFLPHEVDNALCFQPGCREMATVEYRIKGEYCNVAPHDGPHEPAFDERRRFCEAHKTRGDWGFDDSDMNYEEIPLGIGREAP